jgi:hypothetical protein
MFSVISRLDIISNSTIAPITILVKDTSKLKLLVDKWSIKVKLVKEKNKTGSRSSIWEDDDKKPGFWCSTVFDIDNQDDFVAFGIVPRIPDSREIVQMSEAKALGILLGHFGYCTGSEDVLSIASPSKNGYIYLSVDTPVEFLREQSVVMMKPFDECGSKYEFIPSRTVGKDCLCLGVEVVDGFLVIGAPQVFTKYTHIDVLSRLERLADELRNCDDGMIPEVRVMRSDMVTILRAIGTESIKRLKDDLTEHEAFTLIMQTTTTEIYHSILLGMQDKEFIIEWIYTQLMKESLGGVVTFVESDIVIDEPSSIVEQVVRPTESISQHWTTNAAEPWTPDNTTETYGRRDYEPHLDIFDLTRVLESVNNVRLEPGHVATSAHTTVITLLLQRIQGCLERNG